MFLAERIPARPILPATAVPRLYNMNMVQDLQEDGGKTTDEEEDEEDAQMIERLLLELESLTKNKMTA